MLRSDALTFSDMGSTDSHNHQADRYVTDTEIFRLTFGAALASLPHKGFSRYIFRSSCSGGFYRDGTDHRPLYCGSAGGSSRWIKLFAGFRFQPSEFAKIALIMYMAFSLDRKQEKIKSFGAGFLSYMIILMVLLALLLQQPDLGSAATLFLVAFIMLFAAGTRLSYILSVILLSLPLLYYLRNGCRLPHEAHYGFYAP